MLAQHLSLVPVFTLCTVFRFGQLYLSIHFLFVGLEDWCLDLVCLQYGAYRSVSLVFRNSFLVMSAFVGSWNLKYLCIRSLGLVVYRLGFGSRGQWIEVGI